MKGKSGVESADAGRIQREASLMTSPAVPPSAGEGDARGGIELWWASGLGNELERSSWEGAVRARGGYAGCGAAPLRDGKNRIDGVNQRRYQKRPIG